MALARLTLMRSRAREIGAEMYCIGLKADRFFLVPSDKYDNMGWGNGGKDGRGSSHFDEARSII